MLRSDSSDRAVHRYDEQQNYVSQMEIHRTLHDRQAIQPCVNSHRPGAHEAFEEAPGELVDAPKMTADPKTQKSLNVKRAALWVKSSFLGSIIYSNVCTKSNTHRTSGETEILMDEVECETSMVLQVIPSPWVWNRAYRISRVTSLGLSKTQLSTRNVVLENSPCFEMVKHGDRAGLNDLFNMRKASPYDMNSNGRSLLHVSLERLFRAVYKWLCIIQLTLNARWLLRILT